MHYDRYPHTRRSYTQGDAFPERTHGGKTIGVVSGEPRVDKPLQICKLARRFICLVIFLFYIDTICDYRV